MMMEKTRKVLVVIIIMLAKCVSVDKMRNVSLVKSLDKYKKIEDFAYFFAFRFFKQ